MKKVIISALLLTAVVVWIFFSYSTASPLTKKDPEGPQNTVSYAFDRGRGTDSDDSNPHPLAQSSQLNGIIFTKGLAVGQAPEGYFNDALIIGDSRIVGLQLYGGDALKDATWFAATSMGVYNYSKTTVDVEGIGKVGLEELLAKKHFTKIYVCLGINQIGYDMGDHEAKYGAFIKMLRTACPDARVVLVSNLHVAKARSDTDSAVNNPRIDELNNWLLRQQNGSSIFYIECNQLFDDESGAMAAEYTSDRTHLYAKYYPQWSAYLASNAIYQEGDGN